MNRFGKPVSSPGACEFLAVPAIGACAEELKKEQWILYRLVLQDARGFQQLPPLFLVYIQFAKFAQCVSFTCHQRFHKSVCPSSSAVGRILIFDCQDADFEQSEMRIVQALWEPGLEPRRP
jgi:hypothetical protein